MQVGYKPVYASSRRGPGAGAGRLERDASLREEVIDQLGAGWSPNRLPDAPAGASEPPIYRFIYALNCRRWWAASRPLPAYWKPYRKNTRLNCPDKWDALKF